MESAALKRLAQVGDIAKIELSSFPITLAPVKNGVLAWYSGQYAAAGVTVTCEDSGLDKAVSVGAMELSHAAGMFRSTDTITLRPTATQLSISAGTKRASLRYSREPDIELLSTLKSAPKHFRVLLKDFRTEAIIAGSMAAGLDYTVPLLQGVRIWTNNALYFSAADGVSVAYRSNLPYDLFNGSNAPVLDVVVSAKDLQQTLSILTGEWVTLSVVKGALLLRGDGCMLKLPMMPGKWPIPDVLPAEYSEDHVVLPVETIKSLGSASKAYKTDEVIIRAGASGGAYVETVETEAGSYQEKIDGEMSGRVARFTLETLRRSAHLAEDGNVTMTLGPRSGAVYRNDGQRQMLIQLRL